MPKGKTSRPYTRTQKRAVERNQSVLKKAGAVEYSYSGVGPGRQYNSGARAAQATRELGAYVDSQKAKKLKGKRGRK
jgi:hypothetical protein